MSCEPDPLIREAGKHRLYAAQLTQNTAEPPFQGGEPVAEFSLPTASWGGVKWDFSNFGFKRKSKCDFEFFEAAQSLTFKKGHHDKIRCCTAERNGDVVHDGEPRQRL